VDCTVIHVGKKIFQGLLLVASAIVAGALFNASIKPGTDLSIEYENKLIATAIEHYYPEIYPSLDDLRVDYPGFAPVVRRWSEDYDVMFLFGIGRYSVQLPESLVLIDQDSHVKTSRECGPNSGYCKRTAPVHPVRGIVGTVQYGSPGFADAEDFSLEWSDGAKGHLFKSGHCFSAYADASDEQILIIRPRNAEPIRVSTGFGFWLVAANTDSYARIRISESDFVNARQCGSESRKAWPNIGGWWWSR